MRRQRAHRLNSFGRVSSFRQRWHAIDVESAVRSAPPDTTKNGSREPRTSSIIVRVRESAAAPRRARNCSINFFRSSAGGIHPLAARCSSHSKKAYADDDPTCAVERARTHTHTHKIRSARAHEKTEQGERASARRCHAEAQGDGTRVHDEALFSVGASVLSATHASETLGMRTRLLCARDLENTHIHTHTVRRASCEPTTTGEEKEVKRGTSWPMLDSHVSHCLQS